MTLKPGSRAITISALNSSYTSLCEDEDGEAMYRLITQLYPICRSMTGNDVRAMLDLLRAYVPMTVHEVRSGLHQANDLTWGEFLLRGRSLHEVLIFCHICHPSLCNDDLSGIAVATALAQRLLPARSRYSYRFLFIPSTIGSITWLALNQVRVSRVKHSLLLDCLGDSGKPSYQRSRFGDAEVDQAVALVLKESGEDFCAEGPTFVEPQYLHALLTKLLTVIDVLEHNRIYMNQGPYDQAKLGKYGSARLPGRASNGEYQRGLLLVLNSSNGSKSLLDIASDGNLRWDVAKEAARELVARGLITPLKRSRGLLAASKRSVHRSYH
jgi:aminopeptidase-like protein